MTFGPDASSGARITTLDEFNKCLDYFQHESYNEVDTARIYNGGKQEAFTAQAGWKKRNLKIATKSFPNKPFDHEPEAIRAQINTSLEQLQCDKVDIFYLHAADRSVPFERTLKAVDELHKEGKFERLGLSNFAAFEIAEIVMTCREHDWVRRSYITDH
jgi:aflatoxin B1 aldehyde reductase